MKLVGRTDQSFRTLLTIRFLVGTNTCHAVACHYTTCENCKDDEKCTYGENSMDVENFTYDENSTDDENYTYDENSMAGENSTDDAYVSRKIYLHTDR